MEEAKKLLTHSKKRCVSDGAALNFDWLRLLCVKNLKLNELPTELLLNITSYLNDLSDLAAFSSTCRIFHSVVFKFTDRLHISCRKDHAILTYLQETNKLPLFEKVPSISLTSLHPTVVELINDWSAVKHLQIADFQTNDYPTVTSILNKATSLQVIRFPITTNGQFDNLLAKVPNLHASRSRESDGLTIFKWLTNFSNIVSVKSTSLLLSPRRREQFSDVLAEFSRRNRHCFRLISARVIDAVFAQVLLDSADQFSENFIPLVVISSIDHIHLGSNFLLRSLVYHSTDCSTFQRNIANLSEYLSRCGHSVVQLKLTGSGSVGPDAAVALLKQLESLHQRGMAVTLKNLNLNNEIVLTTCLKRTNYASGCLFQPLSFNTTVLSRKTTTAQDSPLSSAVLPHLWLNEAAFPLSALSKQFSLYEPVHLASVNFCRRLSIDYSRCSADLQPDLPVLQKAVFSFILRNIDTLQLMELNAVPLVVAGLFGETLRSVDRALTVRNDLRCTVAVSRNPADDGHCYDGLFYRVDRLALAPARLFPVDEVFRSIRDVAGLHLRRLSLSFYGDMSEAVRGQVRRCLLDLLKVRHAQLVRFDLYFSQAAVEVELAEVGRVLAELLVDDSLPLLCFSIHLERPVPLPDVWSRVPFKTIRIVGFIDSVYL